MNTDPIRVGLAGFGLSGRLFHAPFLRADPRFSLRRICEHTSERSREEYPDVEAVHDFARLLAEDIDLVVVAAPNPLHVPMSREAILAGKHVLVEKPAAAESREVMELWRLAKERGVLYTVYQNRRLDGDFLTVRKLIREGRLGEVVDYECHFDRFLRGRRTKAWKAEGGRGVDLLYDIGIHIIDQAVQLFGMPEEVCADLRQERPESSGVDKFEVTLYYPGSRAILSAGELVAREGPRFMVHGRKGTFLKYGRDRQEELLSRGLRPGEDPRWGEDLPEFYGKLYTVEEDGRVTEETVPTEIGTYAAFYDNLFRVLREGAAPLVTPEEAAAVLRILEAAQISSREKRRIPLM